MPRIKEKELEELVVVLFAKVEIFQDQDAFGPRILIDSRDACIAKTTRYLAEYPTESCSVQEVTKILVPFWWTVDDLRRSLAPRLLPSAERQNR
jgi:hypothetical protein